MKKFNKNQILSTEDLLEQLHRNVDKNADNIHGNIDETFHEVMSRGELSVEFLEDFCSPHMENTVWVIMLKGGGSYLVLELLPFVDCSISNLYKILDSLRVRGLAKLVEGRWHAISPEAFIRGKRNQKQRKF